jgi:hypothetical protein
MISSSLRARRTHEIVTRKPRIHGHVTAVAGRYVKARPDDEKQETIRTFDRYPNGSHFSVNSSGRTRMRLSDVVRSGANWIHERIEKSPPPAPPPPPPKPEAPKDGVDAPGGHADMNHRALAGDGVVSAATAGASGAKTEAKPENKYTREQADADAKSLYDATEGGLTGWGTDEDAIWHTLDGKSAQDISLIRASYQDHYGKDLDHVLRDETSGKDREHVDALLKGKENRGETDAVRIQAELEGTFGDEQEVLKTIEKASPEERHAIAEAYVKKYGGSGDTPEKALLSKIEGDGNFSAEDKNRARALLSVGAAKTPEEARRLEAEAAAGRLKVAVDGAGTDEGTLREVLGGKTKQQIDDIASAYQSRYGHDLRQRLVDETSGPERDEILSLYDHGKDAGGGVAAERDAARIKDAVDGMGTDEDTVRGVLAGKSKQEIDAIAGAYQQRYGHDLRGRLVDETSGAEQQEILSLFDHGKDGGKDPKIANERDAARLKQAMDGAGTDEDAIRGILSGKSKAQIDDLARVYHEKFGDDLRARLDDELDGREQVEILDQMFDRGRIDPNDPGANQERLRRLREQQDVEQGAGLWLTNKIQEATKGESDSQRLDHNVARAEQAMAARDGDRAGQLLGYADGDLDSMVNAKDEAAEWAATGAAVVASTAVVIASGGTATPLVIAAAAAAGATASGGAYLAVEGDAADPADVARQAAIGGVSGATAFVGAGGAVAGKTALGATAKAIAGGAGKSAARTAGEDLGATALEDAALTGGEQATSRGLRQTVVEGAQQGAKGGAAGGAADGATRAATERETWENGLGEGLLEVGRSAVTGAASGAVMGAATGAGLGAGGHAFEHVRSGGRAADQEPHVTADEPGIDPKAQRLIDLEDKRLAAQSRAEGARADSRAAFDEVKKATLDATLRANAGIDLSVMAKSVDFAYRAVKAGVTTVEDLVAHARAQRFARQAELGPETLSRLREALPTARQAAEAGVTLDGLKDALALDGPRGVKTLAGLVGRKEAGLGEREALGLMRDLGGANARSIERLRAAGVSQEDAVAIGKLAQEIGEHNTYVDGQEVMPHPKLSRVPDMVAELLESGRLQDPRALRGLLGDIRRETAGGDPTGVVRKLLNPDPHGEGPADVKYGILQQLEDAWQRAQRPGSGAIAIENIQVDGKPYKADVIDMTPPARIGDEPPYAGEAVAHKEVWGDKDKIVRNAIEGVDQLNGRRQVPEIAPPNTRRLVDIRVRDGNWGGNPEAANLTKADIIQMLKNSIDTEPLRDGARDWQEIRVTNNRGVHRIFPEDLQG